MWLSLGPLCTFTNNGWMPDKANNMQLHGINVHRRSSWFSVGVNGRPVDFAIGESDAMRLFEKGVDQAHLDWMKENEVFVEGWDRHLF